MIKKLGLFTAICLFGLHSVQVNAQEMSPEEQYKAQRQSQSANAVRPKLKMPQSIVVCRSKQCAPARLSMAKEYIFNTLLHMFDSNARQKALVCQGNANTHACTEEFITVPITVGVTPAYLYIDDVKIADVSISQRNTMALNLLLNWGVSYNGQTPTCRPSKNLLYVKNVNNVIMEDNGYTCKMTTIGNTIVSTMFAIDYIDLDYGYIGGYYSIGLSGPAYGGGSGYMIIRLPNDITVEAKDFEVKPLEPKIEESVEETIEEIPVKEEKAPVEEKSVKQAEVPVEETVELSIPTVQNGYGMQGQYLYDASTGQYIPLRPVENEAPTPQPQVIQAPAQPVAAPTPQPQAVQAPAQPVAVPAPQPQAMQAPVQQPMPVVEPQMVNGNSFQYAAPVQYGYGVSAYMPSDNELVSDMLAQNQSGVSAPLMTSVPQNQTMMPQVPVYGQYFYDARSGQYVPLYGQYQLDSATGQYVPLSMLPQQQVLSTPYAAEQQVAREPQAPNVSTIIKYNHPAQQYEKAKAEEKAAVARQRKIQKEEEQAVDFGGVKVFPIPSSNADRTRVAPTLKNSLSEYNNQSNRRYE